MDAYDMTDHRGRRLVHSRPHVNGVDLHCATGGSGQPVYLVHGTPKTMFAWRHIIPLLTPHYEVVVLDCRGAGDSQRPLTGYDTQTLAGDVAELATYLGHDRFRIVGEDWGAAVAYAVAALHRDRVVQLVYQEMRLPGVTVPGADAGSGLAPEDTRTGWHFTFFSVPHYPELLMPGHERAFWSAFMTRQMWDSSALTRDDIDVVVDWISRPGGLHTILSMYRAKGLDAEQNAAQFPRLLTVPVLAVGGAAYLGAEVEAHMRQVAVNVRGVVLDGCGHNPQLEVPHRLAEAYLAFFSDGSVQDHTSRLTG